MSDRRVEDVLNSHGPPLQLPSEILVLILEHLVGEAFESDSPERALFLAQMTMSQVCSRWRAIAITTSSLWTTVAIRVMPRDPCFIYPPRQAIERQMERTKGRPLDVRLALHDGSYEAHHGYIRSITMRACRLTLRLLQINTRFLDSVITPMRFSGKLKILEIDLDLGLSHPAHRSPILQLPTASRLQSFHYTFRASGDTIGHGSLPHTNLPLPHIGGYVYLENLTIRDPTDNYQFAGMLKQCPELKLLLWDTSGMGNRVGNLPKIASLGEIFLPQLRTLFMQGNSPFVTLSYLNAPALTSLEFQSTNTRVDEDPDVRNWFEDVDAACGQFPALEKLEVAEPQANHVPFFKRFIRAHCTLKELSVGWALDAYDVLSYTKYLPRLTSLETALHPRQPDDTAQFAESLVRAKLPAEDFSIRNEASVADTSIFRLRFLDLLTEEEPSSTPAAQRLAQIARPDLGACVEFGPSTSRRGAEDVLSYFEDIDRRLEEAGMRLHQVD